jgi:hypothetical protein
MAEQESVYLWSTTALTNGTIDPPVAFPEGMLPGAVNNSARALMAAVARYIKDTNGSLTTAGSANAYTLTINGRQTPLATGHILKFKASFSITGAATLAVTNADAVALGTKAIRGQGDVALASGQMISGGVYIARYDSAANSAAGAWILLNAAVTSGLLAANNLSDVANAATAFSNIKQDATDTTTGVVELATTTEAATGTDTTRAITAAGLAARTRRVLTANTSFYVRTDGSDSNDGSANTSGAAWLTIQKAANYLAYSVDLNGFVATVNVAAGTYTGAISCFRPFVGGSLSDANGGVIFSGDTTTPANVIISTSSATCFAASFGAHFGVQGFKMTAATVGDCLYASAQGRIFINGKVEFGAVATGSYHMRANAQGWIGGGSSYNVSGTPGSAHYTAQQGGMIEVSGVTVTITGSPTFSFWAYATALGHMNLQGNTYSGAVTAGTKYYVDYNSVVNSGVTLPGGTAGTADAATGGRYL